MCLRNMEHSLKVGDEIGIRYDGIAGFGIYRLGKILEIKDNDLIITDFASFYKGRKIMGVRGEHMLSLVPAVEAKEKIREAIKKHVR